MRELRNVLERGFIETQAEVIGARAFTEWVGERQDFAPGRWGIEAVENRQSRPISPPYPLASEHRLLTAASQPVIDVGATAARPSARTSTRPLELDAVV